MNNSLEIKEITDKAVWDAFQEKHGPWNLFQSFDWGEIEKAQEYKVIRFGVYQDQLLVGIAQFIVVRAKRGIYLHLRHGPIISKEGDRDIWQKVVDKMRLVAKEEGAWFIRISPLMSNSASNYELLASFGLRPAPIHAMDAEICWVLDLDKNENELLMGMRKTTRYLIRQAEKTGVVIDKSDDIQFFLKLYDITSKRHKFIKHTGIQHEFDYFRTQNKVQLYIAKYHRELLAAAIIIYFGSQAIYHHGASIPTKIPATYLLQWRAIQDAKTTGKTIYNFWGIAPVDKPNHPWRGITLFKQGFGGRAVHFMHTHDLPLSPLYFLPYTIEVVRKMRRGY